MTICLCIVCGCFQTTTIELNSWATGWSAKLTLWTLRKCLFCYFLYLNLLYLIYHMEPLQTMQFLEHAMLSLTLEHLHVPPSRKEYFFVYSGFSWWSLIWRTEFFRERGKGLLSFCVHVVKGIHSWSSGAISLVLLFWVASVLFFSMNQHYSQLSGRWLPHVSCLHMVLTQRSKSGLFWKV